VHLKNSCQENKAKIKGMKYFHKHTTTVGTKILQENKQHIKKVATTKYKN